MKTATVIIPCHNEMNTIRACLTSILANDYAAFDVLVVNDGSTDETTKILEAICDPRLRILSLAHRGGSTSAKNKGLEQTNSEVIFFTDADCVVTENWISSGISSFADPAVLAVEGPILYDRQADSLRYKMPVNPFYHSLPTRQLNTPDRDFACGNMAYRRAALSEVGGFRSNLFMSGREDTDLAVRVKSLGKIAFSHTMVVTHFSEFWDWASLSTSACRYQADVAFLKEHHFFPFSRGPVLHPRFLLLMFCPFLIPAFYRIKSLDELKFCWDFWRYIVKLRLVVWRSAWRCRVWAI